MTTTDTVLPTAESLAGELSIIEQEIELTSQQLERLRAEREAAIIAEDEAGQALRAAEAVFRPLLQATKQDDQQAIFGIGDAWWRASFPEAAQAYGRVQAGQLECQKAAARTDRLHRAVLDAEKRRLPALQTAARDKAAELEQFRAHQAHTIATREVTLKANLDRFRRRLRGEK